LIPELRKKFNSCFTQSRYQEFLADINSQFGYKVEFRIAETPIFLPEDLKNELLAASNEIVSFLQSEEYGKISSNAILAETGYRETGYRETGYRSVSTGHRNDFPQMLALDFAICRDENGKLHPQLIELQGFPSLYCYQAMLDQKYRQYYEIDRGLKNYFSGLDFTSYIQMLKEIILGDSNPENVILLEIQPEKQKTRIDFSCTEKWLGIKAVCVTEIMKAGKELYYPNAGKKTKIERIYNRVILDELQKRSELKLNFDFHDELDVRWIPHPEWFFRISKFTLPFLNPLFRRDGSETRLYKKYVPPSAFLNELDRYPDDLENYILKPLYSFAGSGVIYDVSKEILNSISEKQNYILQKKVDYAPVIETPDIPAKAETRLLFLFSPEETGRRPVSTKLFSPEETGRRPVSTKPVPVHNIVRLSKGKMMGVDFNKDQTWVGSSIAYYY